MVVYPVQQDGHIGAKLMQRLGRARAKDRLDTSEVEGPVARSRRRLVHLERTKQHARGGMLQGRLHAQTRRPWFFSQTSQRSDFQLQSLGLQAVAMKRSKGHQRLEHRRSRDRLPLQRNPDQGTPESGVVAAKGSKGQRGYTANCTRE